MLRAGIIGVGFIGRAHIEAIRRLGYVEVAALCEPDLELARRTASELSIPAAFNDYQEMLNDETISVVHNCTPNHLHYQVNKDIVSAGKHVISEKPLALSTQESSHLTQLAVERGVLHAVNYNYRQYPLIQQLKQMVVSNALGRPHLVRGSYLQDWMLYETDFNWRVLPQFGGRSRAVADIGSHWMDLVQDILGDRISHVFADLGPILSTRIAPDSGGTTFGGMSSVGDSKVVKVSTEDFAHILIRFESGVRGALTLSQMSAGRKNKLVIEVDGSKASAAWDQENPNYLWVGHRDRANELMMSDPSIMEMGARPYIHYPGGHHEGWPDAIANTMRSFYQSVLHNRKSDSTTLNYATFLDGHNTMRIVDAILESSEHGCWVPVERD